MQKVSTKKMSHKAARVYRDELGGDAVMYEHNSGSVYLLPAADDPSQTEADKPEYVTEDTNELLIG